MFELKLNKAGHYTAKATTPTASALPESTLVGKAFPPVAYSDRTFIDSLFQKLRDDLSAASALGYTDALIQVSEALRVDPSVVTTLTEDAMALYIRAIKTYGSTSLGEKEAMPAQVDMAVPSSVRAEVDAIDNALAAFEIGADDVDLFF